MNLIYDWTVTISKLYGEVKKIIKMKIRCIFGQMYGVKSPWNPYWLGLTWMFYNNYHELWINNVLKA